jgi:hypothetical protein
MPAPFGLRVRMMAIAGVLLTITALVLVDCVVHNLTTSTIAQNGAAQGADTRSQQLRVLMLMSQQHQQPTQNESPPPMRR